MAKKRTTAKKRDSLHMLIVEARFYDNISDELLRGATRVLEQAGHATTASPSLVRSKYQPQLR